MKKAIFCFLLCPFFLFSQAENPPSLFEVINLTVKAGHEDAFEAAVKSHNTRFHPEGAYSADLYYNINGPSGNTYSWIMGPTTWAALDTRPGTGAHDDDWANAVGQHVESGSPPEYWSGSAELSHFNQASNDSKSLIWMFDLKSGKGSQWAELVGKVKKVYEAKRPNENFLVAWNTFSSTDGYEAVMVWPLANWAAMDDQRNFGAEFEEVHGPGSWHNFLNHIDECVKSRVDWMREDVD